MAKRLSEDTTVYSLGDTRDNRMDRRRKNPPCAAKVANVSSCRTPPLPPSLACYRLHRPYGQWLRRTRRNRRVSAAAAPERAILTLSHAPPQYQDRNSCRHTKEPSHNGRAKGRARLILRPNYGSREIQNKVGSAGMTETDELRVYDKNGRNTRQNNMGLLSHSCVCPPRICPDKTMPEQFLVINQTRCGSMP